MDPPKSFLLNELLQRKVEKYLKYFYLWQDLNCKKYEKLLLVSWNIQIFTYFLKNKLRNLYYLEITPFQNFFHYLLLTAFCND